MCNGVSSYPRKCSSRSWCQRLAEQEEEEETTKKSKVTGQYFHLVHMVYSLEYLLTTAIFGVRVWTSRILSSSLTMCPEELAKERVITRSAGRPGDDLATFRKRDAEFFELNPLIL
ncbi:hypothetical protein B0H63DRAFT_471037 [Podospora didyma]|uniref:Uncharacterized protein n=1 Tax=Podospora didyma TaxID=330526 RepID=A0AAE0U1T0_9PEZI|nr:hypothetical protein B0H63DRAFT_471037 [Podospora didyma]